MQIMLVWEDSGKHHFQWKKGFYSYWPGMFDSMGGSTRLGSLSSLFTKNGKISDNNDDERWLDYWRHELDKVNSNEEFAASGDDMHKAHRHVVSFQCHISGLCYKNQMEVYDQNKSLGPDYVALSKRNLGMKYTKSQMSNMKHQRVMLIGIK